MKLIGHPMTWLFDRCTDQFQTFSRFLAKAEVDFWRMHAWDKRKKKQQQQQQPDGYTDRKYDVGISSIFDTVFRDLPIFRTVLRYWVPPNVPLLLQYVYCIQFSGTLFRMFWRSVYTIAIAPDRKIHCIAFEGIVNVKIFPCLKYNCNYTQK